MRRLRVPLCLFIFSNLCVLIPAIASGESRVFPAPDGVELSRDFVVTIDGKSSPVYPARVGPEDPTRRWRAMDDIQHSAELYDTAAYTTFDIAGAAIVTIDCPQDVHSVSVLPTAAGIAAKFSGRTITIPLKSAANLTVEVNGDWCHSLHLFANPIETNIPSATDPNVIYFGPGVHDVPAEGIVPKSGQTVYLAGGAILRAVVRGKPVVRLEGDHVALRGRGIIDASAAPTSSRTLVEIKGKDVHVEGVILHDSPGWSMPLRGASDVTIENVKLFTHRKYGDGIDICNSQNVVVDQCFVRTLDDCIVVKTNQIGQASKHILVKHCILWNQVAHALSIGAELREPVDDVVFTDCDVIHDTGRDWTMRVYHCDSAPITNIRFDHIRVEQAKRLISLWIGKANWSKDSQRGHIDDVLFSNITATGEPLTISLQGYDAEHKIGNAKFEHVILNGHPLTNSEITTNAHVVPPVVLP